MDSTMKKEPEKILVCKPVSEGPAYVPSQKVLCSNCHREVWVADTSPQARAICTDCFVRLPKEEQEQMVIAPPTLAQQEEMAAYYQAHPEEKDAAIQAFESVTSHDITEIEGLCEVIERLCSSLRELRAENPDKFFGRPVENLYKSLEAALDSFYRSKVESTSPSPENPS